MTLIRPALFALMATALSPMASAQVLQEKNLPLTIAADIAQQAVQICLAEGYNVTAAVVDRSGTLRALMRADNAAPHTVNAAQRKAYTSASTRNLTSTVADNIQKNPAASQLAAVEGFLVLAGGAPIKAGNEVIGAVGVGGAPGGQLDEACALKAIEKVQAKLK
ncbi:GlcG/HbpS family heme-binding protein [Bordetella avium]|uniref:Exported protein n=1 Tax=Bordetella avium (strain 197N) TaxID=360910 RepID=Q2L0U1_BORA1|nr:heme-binding protein [Bordetella avium]AZY49175.1 heme-binding protein [Bordetella avium]AZY52530.1 heme-binding protein [Bordetella avium]RIQ12323.1 heme-binding protein [Bordetella avium]RIQ19304.1 heme-binding protein [Bordetella avium]RIQ33473.1 heme-binding protein [Bordetella avium]